jgi:CHASE2 domain-containing sensor protein
MTARLLLSVVGVIVSLILSAIAFYYLHATAPLVPLLVGLTGAIPMGIIIDELRHSIKVKKAQQSHHPPHRS